MFTRLIGKKWCRIVPSMYDHHQHEILGRVRLEIILGGGGGLQGCEMCSC